MSTKSENFHRLATKRIETVTEAIRIFGNLCSANYEWTPDEVLTYTGQIEAALNETLARFQETKRWPAEQQEQTLDVKPELEVLPSTPVYKDRKLSISEILKESNSPEVLAEMISMQRAVIERLQSQLDQ